MFLKRLELHGFKSFGHKTAIEFMDGVTIVVGPNGCGKSNVLDSIKWVLGETSAKSLRGAKMGDVVFRGSASLKPANFAQVNLIVNNDARNLQMDHSEVMVTRRLFSNGDSEYLINKHKSRMRDIHELFLDTGLGADGYSIIEQGQIGQMVQAKPKERRDLFEEAAGISRYKARREETLRKLIRTEEDLIRLFDIVSEVQRSCNSLYRQARKAIRHRKYTKRLTRLQKRLLVVRHGLLKEKLERVSERLEVAQKDFEEANSKLATAEAKRAEASRLIEEHQKNVQSLQQQRYDLQQAIHREQRRSESATQAIGAVKERIELIDREMDSSTNRVQVLSRTIQVLEIDLEKERAELQNAINSMDSDTQRLDALKLQYESLNGEVLKLRQELQTERSKVSKVEQDKALAESNVERLTQELANHGEMMQELRQKAEEAEKEQAAARADLEAQKSKLASLKEESAAIKDLIDQQAREKGELARKYEETTQKYNKMHSRLNALEEVESSYEGFFRGVQVVMKASQAGELSGIQGVLTNLVIVPSKYEVAIEVAMGSSLQDIVVASEKDAQRAIEYLKSRRQGRATFLPLDLLHTNVRTDHLERILNRPGVLGLAKDLVEYDSNIEKAIARRLGNTVIVEQLQTAIQLEREGVRNRYVSLEGELVDPSGVLTGGSHQSRGFLSRGREIRDLRDQVEALDREKTQIHDELAAANDSLSQAHARAGELQSLTHEVQMAEARAEKDTHSAEQRAKERRNALATGEAREVQQRHDLQMYKERLDACDEGLEGLAGGLKVKEERIQKLEEDLGGSTSELDVYNEKVSAGREKLSGLRERVNALSSKLDEIRTERDSAGTDQISRVEEKERLQKTMEESEETVKDAEKLLGDLILQRDKLESEFSQLEQESEVRLKDAKAGVAELQTLQRDRNVKENALREVELSSTDLKAQIKVLNEEARDEFEGTIQSITEDLETELNQEQEDLGVPEQAESEDNSEESEEQRSEEADSDAGLFEEDDQVTNPSELRKLVSEMRDKISRMGAVNETAIEEYKEQKERLDFLSGQRDDLIKAKDSLQETITNLDETTKRLFDEAYTAIQKNFQDNFRRLFNGGKGDLLLVEEENQPEPGIEIFAQPPGKNIGGSIQLMSGGEKAMTAIALMLALFQYKPSPICILDEIDAPLDDVNCNRLCDALKEYAKTTQFLIITHNKITMSLADTIYGVTMQEPGISKMVSVKFDNIEESGLLENAS